MPVHQEVGKNTHLPIINVNEETDHAFVGPNVINMEDQHALEAIAQRETAAAKESGSIPTASGDKAQPSFGKQWLPGCRVPVPPVPFRHIKSEIVEHSSSIYLILDPTGMPYYREHILKGIRELGCEKGDISTINFVHSNYVWDLTFKDPETRRRFSDAHDHVMVQGHRGELHDPNVRRYRATLDWLPYGVKFPIVFRELEKFGTITNEQRQVVMVEDEPMETNVLEFDYTLHEGILANDVPAKFRIADLTGYLAFRGVPSCLSCGARGHYRTECSTAYCSTCRNWFNTETCPGCELQNFKHTTEYVEKQTEKKNQREEKRKKKQAEAAASGKVKPAKLPGAPLSYSQAAAAGTSTSRLGAQLNKQKAAEKIPPPAKITSETHNNKLPPPTSTAVTPVSVNNAGTPPSADNEGFITPRGRKGKPTIHLSAEDEKIKFAHDNGFNVLLDGDAGNGTGTMDVTEGGHGDTEDTDKDETFVDASERPLAERIRTTSRDNAAAPKRQRTGDETSGGITHT